MVSMIGPSVRWWVRYGPAYGVTLPRCFRGSGIFLQQVETYKNKLGCTPGAPQGPIDCDAETSLACISTITNRPRNVPEDMSRSATISDHE
jgi:hypothetical protein